MSLALDTNQTVDYSLGTDEAKGQGARPLFVFRFITSREFAEMSRLFQAADQAKDEQEHLKLCYDAIRIPLVGWQNMSDRDGAPIEFDPANLDMITSPVDIIEMRKGVLEKLTLEEIDRKNSARQLRCSSNRSAAAAGETDTLPIASKNSSNAPDATEPAARLAGSKGTRKSKGARNTTSP